MSNSISWAIHQALCCKKGSLMSGKTQPLCAARLQASTALALSTLAFCFKTKSLCKKDITHTSDKINLSQHLKQVLHILVSQKHEPIIPQTPLNTKTPKTCKTGQLLQLECHSSFCSCVLLLSTSNTFHSTHSSYPKPPLPTVTPFTVFTISVSSLCRLTSRGWFRPFQNKLSIGKGSGNIKQAQKNLRPHWKLLHCPTRIQLKQVFHELLSLYLGTFSLRFVNERCSTHCPETIHMLSFHLY